MNKHIAVVMDPVERIKPAKDTTFALMLEAQRRGHRLWFYTPDLLSLEGARLTARAHRIDVHDDRPKRDHGERNRRKSDLR